jgi:hypothetical protein
VWYGVAHIAYQLPYDLRINNNDYVIRIAFTVITGLIDVLLSIHISIVFASPSFNQLNKYDKLRFHFPFILQDTQKKKQTNKQKTKKDHIDATVMCFYLKRLPI